MFSLVFSYMLLILFARKTIFRHIILLRKMNKINFLFNKYESTYDKFFIKI
jgi:hypothetical protein